MQNNQTVAIHKIILFVVFISAAIMTSLFIFHLRHPAEKAAISPDEGLLFSVAREIKPFDLLSADQQKFSQQNFLHHWTLLFFGFTHCASICPTTLDLMSRAYGELHEKYPSLQVVLISLDPDRDTPEKLSKYTHSFHPDFIGVTGKIQDIRKLQSQLGIFSAREDSSSNYQIQHTPSIMLINPEGKWAGVYKNGMNPKQLASAFESSMKFFSDVQS